MKRTALTILALASIGATVQAQSLTTFDSITGTTLGFGPATANRQLMGEAFNLGNATGAQAVTGLDLILYSAVAANYTDIQLQITFFNTYNPTATGTTPAFTNPIATIDVDLGAANLGVGLFPLTSDTPLTAAPNDPGIQFSGAPIIFSGTANKGIQFLFRGNTGSGLVATNNLTTAVRGGTGESAFAVGTSANGTAPATLYFRNASNAAPTTSATSLLNTDGRTIGDNSALAIRIYSTPVPEPATMAALGLGAAALLRRRRKSA